MDIRIAVEVGRHAVRTAADRVPPGEQPVTSSVRSLAWLGPEGKLRCGAQAEVAAREEPEHLLDVDWMERLCSYRQLGPGDVDETITARHVLAGLLQDPLRDAVRGLGVDPRDVREVSAALVVPQRWVELQRDAASQVLTQVLEELCPGGEVVLVQLLPVEALREVAGTVAAEGEHVLVLDVGSSGTEAHLIGPDPARDRSHREDRGGYGEDGRPGGPGADRGRAGAPVHDPAPGDAEVRAAIAAGAAVLAVPHLAGQALVPPDRLLLVGGHAHDPALVRAAEQEFGLPAEHVPVPDRQVVLGALTALEGAEAWWDMEETSLVPLAAATDGPDPVDDPRRRALPVAMVAAAGVLALSVLGAGAMQLTGLLGDGTTDPAPTRTVVAADPDAVTATTVPTTSASRTDRTSRTASPTTEPEPTEEAIDAPVGPALPAVPEEPVDPAEPGGPVDPGPVLPVEPPPPVPAPPTTSPPPPPSPTPTPTQPAPTPTPPEPTDPGPTEPVPTPPEPTDPGPTEPGPTDPDPTPPEPDPTVPEPPPEPPPTDLVVG